ncbi:MULTISPECIES: ectoine/hydroxyectoine ABC transporter permease subunit EhuC [Janibacter]|uniref:Amino acid ABC transporter membrane protein 1, PAAT family n=1 Tax=Janibacter indicus TaxID=857417 RepID=A0A1L3MDP1_9MICO|nr:MULTISPECIES: ectoine/hydroxyectoine ABC transporter permease subunit EhuC [Janibacter]APH00435.1 ectoine/hydroxyectoine ABC transporter permease subunit EhuC [Janibacter indicus]QNF94594.1 ectoine/hydroxyectoine ABC transporter permease subunit EhuC [Janibacter sp. YB324]QOK23217.1 ectoine/hydroxyectoine ABC transporter permease subunit EhuC [Janibacter indicus]SMC72490.1 amino acid ABC transporter membrane protein 1, PAAT family [Janibacter indicus]
MTDHLDALRDALPRLGEGVLVTLQLTLGGALVAFVVSVALGLLSISPVAPLRWLATIVVEFFRGTSLVVQLFWLYYVMPLFGVSWDAVLTGVIALGLNYGAYGAEIVRGSINAVDRGQWEGAKALNMSPLTRMRRIIWPQAWVLMLSGYNNLLVMLIKGTAVALFIGLQDLAYEIDQLRINTTTIFAYGIGLIIYYLFALVFSSGLRQLEKRARRRLGLPTRSAHAGAGVAL